MFRTNPGLTHQTVDKKLFSPRRGRIALSVNERIAEFLDFAIQAKFAYVNKLRQGGIRRPPEIIIHTKTVNEQIRNFAQILITGAQCAPLQRCEKATAYP